MSDKDVGLWVIYSGSPILNSQIGYILHINRNILIGSANELVHTVQKTNSLSTPKQAESVKNVVTKPRGSSAVGKPTTKTAGSTTTKPLTTKKTTSGSAVTKKPTVQKKPTVKK